MAHQLTINEQGEAEMFSGQNIVPWHKLGTVVPGLLTAREAIKAARLDWEVNQVDVYANGKQVEGYKANVRSDNGGFLGMVQGRYTPINNSQCFDDFDFIVGEGQAYYDTAGSLFGGSKVWIMAKVPGKLFLNNRPDDTTDKMILLSTSHDGTGSVTWQIVATRVVCANTLSVALGSATNTFKIRHTKNHESKREEAMKTLGLVNGYFDDLQAVMNELDAQAMTQAEMESFTEKLIPSTKEEDSTRTVNIRNEIASLFSTGIGNLGKSRWDALNGVTQWVDHTRGTRTKSGGNADENKFASSMFGSGNALKTKAFQLLTA